MNRTHVLDLERVETDWRDEIASEVPYSGYWLGDFAMKTREAMNHLISGTLSVLTALTIAACGSKGEDGRFQGAPVPAPGAATTAATMPVKIETKDAVCRTLIESYNPSTSKFVASPQTYKVERHFQRVIRKGCSGQVVSDKIETVRSPQVRVRLQLPKPRAFKSVFLFNETSCDHVLSGTPKESTFMGEFVRSILPFSLLSPVNGDGRSYVDVNGDLATALLTFELAQGPNVIYAEYHFDCMPNITGNVRAVRNFDEKNFCEHSTDKQIVMYPIVTTYEEKTLPGVRVEERDKSQCEREALEKK